MTAPGVTVPIRRCFGLTRPEIGAGPDVALVLQRADGKMHVLTMERPTTLAMAMAIRADIPAAGEAWGVPAEDAAEAAGPDKPHGRQGRWHTTPGTAVAFHDPAGSYRGPDDHARTTAVPPERDQMACWGDETAKSRDLSGAVISTHWHNGNYHATPILEPFCATTIDRPTWRSQPDAMACWDPAREAGFERAEAAMARGAATLAEAQTRRATLWTAAAIVVAAVAVVGLLTWAGARP
jgi:hypothetical protein